MWEQQRMEKVLGCRKTHGTVEQREGRDDKLSYENMSNKNIVIKEANEYKTDDIEKKNGRIYFKDENDIIGEVICENIIRAMMGRV